MSSGSSKWRYCNPAYYLKRPKRLAMLFIVFVSVSFVVWDRQTLVREYQVFLHLLVDLIFCFNCVFLDHDYITDTSDQRIMHRIALECYCLFDILYLFDIAKANLD